ncbi:hypothetical protein [Vermiculatibacterium agrestimuris]|uniref:hypothetical protein n=1 Tax=Vermiculatibacterium agrestimuris TaxID=2941519 RepID=UPI00203C5B56|nr:hypothetical protein [Vermiculatibacterium agrestimuris]
MTDGRANHCLPLADRRERVPDITSSDQARRAQGRRPDGTVELVDLYVNNAFYRYLNGEGE